MINENNNNNIEINNIEEEIEMTTNENIATDTAVITAATNNDENKNLEGNTMENNNIAIANENGNIEVSNNTEKEETMEMKTIEAQAMKAAKAAAEAKNVYEKIGREKKAIAEVNKMFGAKKGVASALNQIANNCYKKASAELAIAHLNNVVTDFFTEKKLAAHNKRIATQNAKIAKAEEKIAIYREKLVAANDKLSTFNEAEIVAAALAVLNGTAITPVVAPVVVAPAPVVETIDIDAVMAKINAVVTATRDAANKESMIKSAKELAALSTAIDAPLFDHVNDIGTATVKFIAKKARNAADITVINDYVVSAAAQEAAIMAEIEAANFVPAEKHDENEEEILSCGDGDDVEEISEEDRIAAMSDWNPDFDPEAFLNNEGILSSEDFENKTVIGTVEEPKIEEKVAESKTDAEVLALLNNFDAELKGEKPQVEEPKAEEKPVKVDPIAEARRKMRELMAKKAGKPVVTETAEKKTEETVEKKGSTEEPKAPTKEDETLAREAEAYQKAKAIEEEIYASYDPKTKQYGAYMPKTLKLQKNAQEALYNAFHSENADMHTTAASIWDTIGDETPEIVDPYAPYVAPKAVRTETRYLNVKEYENGEMALPEDSDEAKANPTGANYDDIMAACGY